MAELIGGVSVSCPRCGAEGVANVSRFVWWSNQYGAKVRVFCRVCDAWTDKKLVQGVLDLTYVHPQSAAYLAHDRSEELPF